MKRLTRTFEIEVHSDGEFDYYLSGADRLAVQYLLPRKDLNALNTRY